MMEKYISISLNLPKVFGGESEFCWNFRQNKALMPGTQPAL